MRKNKSVQLFARQCLIGLITLAALAAVPAWAATWYVNPSGDNSDGTSWSKAKTTIQGGVDLATTAGDVVMVTNGTYTLTTPISVLYFGITVKSVNGAASTIVNGGGVTRCLYLNHASAVVDGFTITNALSSSSGGAGVCIESGGGTVKNCSIGGNTCDASWNGGGGVGMMAGLVSNCTIVGNTAKSSGGGVNMSGGTVRDCTISGNNVSGSQSSGGGVYLSSGTLQDCVISGNYALYGGGVDSQGGTVLNCTISGNWGTQQSGAGVRNNSTMRDCLIMGNYTEAVQSWSGSGSVVQNDSTMENCTIVGNSGPVYTPRDSIDQMQWYSVYNNGGTMKNCIVVNNTPGFGNTGSKCTYSCTTPLVSGTGNIMQDPQFVNPGSGSGSSFVAGNYQFLAYSPCINAGVNVAWMNSAKDLAGNARIFNTTVDMGAYEYPAVAPTRLAAPANVAASDGLYGDKVRVTWSSVAGAAGYVVYRGSDSSNVNFSASVSVTASPYNDTNAAPGTTYYYWVAASDANGRSTLSAGDRGYASMYGVNFNNAQVVYLDGNKHLKKIDVDGNISNVFLATNPAIDQILFNQQGDLFIAFPQSMGGPGGSGGVVLNDGYSFIIAKATPSNNSLIGVDHEISQLSWWSDICSPNIQVDTAGNAYYFGVEFSQQPGPGSQKIKLRKYVNGTTNVLDLIPSDNIQIKSWYVRGDGTVLMAGRTESTSSDWFRKLSPQGNLSHIINPPVQPSFIATFPDDMVYAGLQSWTYGGTDYYWPGVYRLPSDLSNPQFAFPYIGNSNYFAGGPQPPGPPSPQSQIFTPEYDVKEVMNGHGGTWSDAFSQCNGAAIRQYVMTSKNGVPDKVFVTSGQNWTGGKTLVQYYPTVEIIELAGIETVTLIEALGDKLVIAGSQGSREKLILYDPSNGAEMDLLNEDIEIYHLQTMYTGHIWFDGLKFTGNKYIAGQFTMQIVYSANGKASFQAPKVPKSAYREVTLGEKPSAFVGVLSSTLSTNVTPTTAPSAPTRVAASDGTYSDKIRVTWRASAGATSYEVYRHTSDSSGSATKIGDATTVGYEDTTAEASVYYYYWVKAVNAVGSSDYSASDTGCLGTGCMDVAGDFDGDRIADPALASTDGDWYVWMSSAGFSKAGPFPLSVGIGTGTALEGDFDGDRKADPVWVSGNNWYVWMSASGYQSLGPIPIGKGSYTPLVGDFDGDRIADPAMVDNTGWTFLFSSAGYAPVFATFATDGSYFLAGDMDGDRRDDPIAVNGAGLWMMYYSGNGYTPTPQVQYGMAGNTPAVGDFDGDRRDDIVCVNGMGDWYVYFSSAGFSVASGPFRFEP